MLCRNMVVSEDLVLEQAAHMTKALDSSIMIASLIETRQARERTSDAFFSLIEVAQRATQHLRTGRHVPQVIFDPVVRSS